MLKGAATRLIDVNMSRRPCWQPSVRVLHSVFCIHGLLVCKCFFTCQECALLKEVIRMAISLLKTGKTPGSDEIPAEAIKADRETFIEILYDLIGNIWDTEEIPIELKEGYRCQDYKERRPARMQELQMNYAAISAWKSRRQNHNCYWKY